MPTLLNWFKLVYGPFGKWKMHRTLLSRPARKESNVPKLKISLSLSVLIYILWIWTYEFEFSAGVAYAAATAAAATTATAAMSIYGKPPKILGRAIQSWARGNLCFTNLEHLLDSDSSFFFCAALSALQIGQTSEVILWPSNFCSAYIGYEL